MAAEWAGIERERARVAEERERRAAECAQVELARNGDPPARRVSATGRR